MQHGQVQFITYKQPQESISRTSHNSLAAKLESYAIPKTIPACTIEYQPN